MLCADLCRTFSFGQHGLYRWKAPSLIQIKIFIGTVIFPKLFFAGTPVPEVSGRKPSSRGHIDILCRNRCRTITNLISCRVIVYGICLRICATSSDSVAWCQVIDSSKTGRSRLDVIKIPTNISVSILRIDKVSLSIALLCHENMSIKSTTIRSGPADIYFHTGPIAVRCHCPFDCLAAAAGSFVDNRVFPCIKRVIRQAIRVIRVRQRADIIATFPQFVGGHTVRAVSRPCKIGIVYLIMPVWIDFRKSLFHTFRKADSPKIFNSHMISTSFTSSKKKSVTDG